MITIHIHFIYFNYLIVKLWRKRAFPKNIRNPIPPVDKFQGVEWNLRKKHGFPAAGKYKKFQEVPAGGYGETPLINSKKSISSMIFFWKPWSKSTGTNVSISWLKTILIIRLLQIKHFQHKSVQLLNTWTTNQFVLKYT